MMKKVAQYNTTQRELLLDILKENKDRHLTVTDIVALCAEKNIKIGQTTIYRYLNILEHNGTVRKYVTDGFDGSCYQFVSNSLCHQHLHLRCIKCEKLFHVDNIAINAFTDELENKLNFVVDMSKTVLYGICTSCR